MRLDSCLVRSSGSSRWILSASLSSPDEPDESRLTTFRRFSGVCKGGAAVTTDRRGGETATFFCVSGACPSSSLEPSEPMSDSESSEDSEYEESLLLLLLLLELD